MPFQIANTAIDPDYLRDPQAAARNSVISTAPAVPDYGLPPGVGPEGILLILGDRVRDMDGQIALFQRTIQSRTDRAQQIQHLLSELQDLAGKAGAMTNGDLNLEKYDDQNVDAGKNVHDRIIGQAAEMGIIINMEIESKNNIKDDNEKSQVGDGPSSGVITKETLQSALDRMKGELSATNSGNETDMIYLQSITQTRTAQIQLISNIMNDVHQTDQQVIANIK